MSNIRILDRNGTSDLNVENVAAMCKALSNPTRLKIFMYLSNCCATGSDTGNRCVTSAEIGASVGEVGDQVEVVASTVSHHIKELQHAGLIKCSRRGQQIICCVDSKALTALREFVESVGGKLPDDVS